MIINRYIPALIQIATVVLGAVVVVEVFDTASVVQLALLVVAAVGTYFLPLVAGPWNGALKTGLAIITAGLTAAAPFIIDGRITGQQVAVVVLAIVGALGTHLGIAVRKDTSTVLEMSTPPAVDEAPRHSA